MTEQNINENKKLIRKQIKAQKLNLSLQDKKDLSIAIFEKINNLQEFKTAKTILVYWSLPDEVFTHDIVDIWHKSKTILLPCVVKDDLILRQYTGKDSMICGDFNISEPIGPQFDNLQDIDLIIVPGVAFDNNCNRLGRGRGFYDRLLKTTSCKKIGICFDCQIVDKVPKDNFDIAMDKVITTNHIYG